MRTIEVTTRSGFKLKLEDAGADGDGNQLWRQVDAKLGRDEPRGLDTPYDWAAAAWNGT